MFEGLLGSGHFWLVSFWSSLRRKPLGFCLRDEVVGDLVAFHPRKAVASGYAITNLVTDALAETF